MTYLATDRAAGSRSADAERPDAVAAEHRELLAAITRGDRTRAGRIAGNHATATATASAADASPSATQGA